MGVQVAGEFSAEQLIVVLENLAGKIGRLEADAHVALYEKQDEAAYRLKLEEKTELLIALPATVANMLSGLKNTEVRAFVQERIEKFGASASNAKKISSIFYMSALLYPEDYQEGEENDFENFIASLKKKISSN